MTLDELQRRDARIGELEARGRQRTPDEQEQLGRLYVARDHHWRRLPEQIDRAARRLADMSAYARQIGLPYDRGLAD
jgi:hypothetical protein